MTAAELEQNNASEEVITAWRLEQLLGAGYERKQARLIARRRDIDLHRALELPARGCSHELALAILL